MRVSPNLCRACRINRDAEALGPLVSAGFKSRMSCASPSESNLLGSRSSQSFGSILPAWPDHCDSDERSLRGFLEGKAITFPNLENMTAKRYSIGQEALCHFVVA